MEDILGFKSFLFIIIYYYFHYYYWNFVLLSRLFSYNGSVPFGDRFCCENDLLSVLKWKEKGPFVWENRTEQL